MKRQKNTNPNKNTPSGFDSRTCYNETRSQSGFLIHTDTESDQTLYQIYSIIKNANQLNIKPYKLAQYYLGKKEHFVYYSWYSLERKKYIREKVFLKQSGLTIEEKQRSLIKLCNDLNAQFTIQNSKGIYDTPDNREKYSLEIKYWLQLATSDEEVGKEQRKLFTSLLTKIEKIKWQKKELDQFPPSTIKAFVKLLHKDQLAGKTINNYLWAIEKISAYAKGKGAINSEIKTDLFRVAQPQNETGRFPPLSNSEKELVFEYYKKHNPPYYLFILTLYYTCIRPKELHRLKISNINFENGTIFIPWFKAKNGLSNHVQILKPLMEAFRYYGLDKTDSKYYIFSTKCLPGKTHYQGNYCSDQWLNNRVKIGIDDSRQMYGLKHTFNVDYVNNNHHALDWEWLRRHNRHATITQTHQYISGLTAYFLDESKANIFDYFKKKRVTVDSN